MTTPRGPRGNRRPRVAGQPATRPTSPQRPTSKPTDKAPSAAEDDEVVDAPVSIDSADTTPAEKRPATADAAPQATTTDETHASEEASDEVPATSDDARADADEDTDEPDTDGSATTRVELSKTPTPASAGPRGKARPKVKVSTIKPQPTRPAPKRPTATAPGTPGGARRRRFFGWRTVGVLAVIAAVVGALAGVAAARPGVDLSDNQAFVDPSLTSQVSAQAKSRICSVFGVNYAKLDDWERTAKANVTGEASEAFTRYAGAVRDAIGQTGLTEGGVDCRVDTVGVRDISGGDATLVANLILSQTQGQQATGSGTKRYQVGMRQVNGQWLISSFSDF